MRKVLLFVLLLGLIGAAAGLLALGAFPPQPTPHAVQKVLPNDKFQVR
jgi:hypothetical protein